ncbi:pancreatic lipase-related protein 2-like [Lithobates pipiens]
MFLSKIITILVMYSLSSETVKGTENCYDNLGCFYDDIPWSGTPQRKVIPLPWSPEKINTRFFLHTRDNPQLYQEISSRDIMSIKNSVFRAGRKTIFIVHGMTDKAEDNWVSQMILEILQAEDVNCVGVDWRNGSANLQMYAQASSNVQVVGAEISYLVTRLQEELEYPPSKVHLIGHSLGAHVAGEAGKRCRGIGRITGLDPARPFFEDTDKVVHLDASDAEFVDIIHTDTEPFLGLGMMKPTGHYDFYPNGGQHMTGCPSKLSFLTGNAVSLVKSMACNHLRAPLFYIESIRNPGGFLSYPCENYMAFQDGSCFPCPSSGCPAMGHYADLSHRTTTQHQTFYLHTGGDPHHFLSYRYKISVSLVGKKKISGKIYISLFSDHISTPEYEVVQGTLLPGNRYSGFINADVKLDEVNCVDFRWTPPLLQSNIFQIQLGAEQVDVQSGEDGEVSSFCSFGTVRDNMILTLGLCTVRTHSHYDPKSSYREDRS